MNPHQTRRLDDNGSPQPLPGPTAFEASSVAQRALWVVSLLCVTVLTSMPEPADAAQNRGVRFRRVVQEDGLPGAEVRQIIQDQDGFIWLASGAGLSRYDGYEFISFAHSPDDPASLSHNFVFSILESRDGVLWVGSDGGGLSRFDPMTRRFTNFRHDPSSAESLADDRVRVVREGPKGNLWLGTEGSGVAVFDRATSSFRTLRHQPGQADSLSHDKVRDLLWARDGLLWVATLGGGVSLFDPQTESFQHFRHNPTDPRSLSSDKVGRIYEGRQGQIWIGTKGGGLNRFNRDTWSFDRVALLPAGEATLRTNSVTSILEDSAGTLWVGTDAGLFERQVGLDRFSYHGSRAADAKSIPHESVRTLFEDRGGLLWVGTRGGLATWNTNSGSFVHHFRASEERGELSDNWVNAFAEDPAGAVWIGTLDGLSRFDRGTDRFDEFRSSAGDPSSLSDDRVMALEVDRQGVLWVGTMGGGLNRRDPASGAFSAFVNDPLDPASVSSNGITALHEDRDGTMWVGTFGGGLNRLDRASGTFERFEHDPDDPESLSSNEVLSIHEGRDGQLWVGTVKDGLNLLHRDRGGFTHFRHDPDDPASLSSDSSWWITSDARDNLWIATRDAGINRWSAEDRHAGRPVFRRFGRADGLDNATVYTILEARDGDLWLSTETGLSRFDPESELFVDYDSTDGLQEEFNQNAAARLRNGDLYFGGTRGFNAVSPEGIGTNPNPPIVVLTNFLKFNEPFSLGVPTARVDRISIGHGDLVVAFEFAALDYTAPAKNRFRYMLEGFDRDWVNAQGVRRATYTNLDPGHYVFKVRGSNNDGVWSEQELSVGLIMVPPPWRSWWAHSIYALAFGCCAIIIWRAIQRRRRRALELSRMNVSLTREVSARREKERALEAEKMKAREYLDVAEVVMVAIDSEGLVKLVNQKGSRVLGFEEEEIVGADWVETFVPVARRAEVADRLAHIEDHPYCEYPIVSRSGEERVIAWHSTQLPSADGGWVTLSSGTDNTEIHALEKQVRMQQKMDALGTLAGGIAHDFNNILTAILGYSTLTLSQLEPESEEAGYMRHVIGGCERASDMVSRILTFSRREDSDKKPVDIGAVVIEACELLRSSLSETIEIRTSIAPELELVAADATQIHQVLMNLGTNAAHAMPSGGVLEVSVEMVEVAPGSQTLSGELRRGRYVRMGVKDSGEGMDKATVQRIFEPFFTTKEVGTGTGLGLSVAHGIVKGHQGDISVRSAPGKGTTVVVRLPSSDKPIAREEGVSELVGGDECVLFVDDERPIVLLAKRWLEDQGYQVEAHTNGVEALAAFRANPRKFDLLIADHNMPEMQGEELVEEARRLVPRLPVVMTSGRDLRVHTEELDSVWLQKPFKLEDLAASVRIALAGGRSLRSVS